MKWRGVFAWAFLRIAGVFLQIYGIALQIPNPL